MITGAHIEQLRTRAGLTQAQLAKSAGLTQAAVSSFETGRGEMKTGSLGRILRVLGVTVELSAGETRITIK